MNTLVVMLIVTYIFSEWLSFLFHVQILSSRKTVIAENNCNFLLYAVVIKCGISYIYSYFYDIRCKYVTGQTIAKL